MTDLDREGSAAPRLSDPARLAALPGWAWAAFAGALLLVTWLAGPFRTGATLGLSLLPALAVVAGVRRYRPSRSEAWGLFAAGMALQAVGVLGIALAGGMPVDPTGLGDGPRLAAVQLLPVGALVQLAGAFAIVRGRSAFDPWAGLDTAVIAVAAGFLVWFLLLDPAIDAGATTLIPLPGLLPILLIDLLFVELGLRVLFAGGRRRPAGWLFLGATAAALLSQLAFTAQVADGTYRFGGSADLGWQLASIGWAVMALHPSMAGLVGVAAGPRRGTISRPRLVAMALAALVVPAILVADAVAPGHPWGQIHMLAAGLGSGAVLAMVILRMGAALFEVRRQREALEQSQEGYRSLVEQSSEAIFVLDGGGRVTEANAAAGALLGRPPEELVGRAWVDLIDPEDLAAHPLRFTALQPGRSVMFERRLRGADDQPVAVELGAKRLSDGRFLHTARDITERVRAEEERSRLVASLEARERDLEEAQRIARVGSWTLDPATGHATWSEEMYRILGLDPDGPAVDLGDIGRLFTPDSVAEVTAAVERAAAAGEPWHLELEAVRPDGSHGWVTSRGVVERDEAGRVMRIRGTMQDVTEQRALEAQLRQAQRLEGVGQLAGGIAHDFNNLLTAIRGYAEFLRGRPGQDDESRSDVDQILLASDRAAELTRQLLAFSRRQVLQPQVVDPAEVVAGIAPMLRRLLGEHVELVAPVPPERGCVRVDPSQLEQVILNLAVNARDAMPAGGRLAIEVANVELDAEYAAGHAGTQPGPHVALVVSDSGSGMDAATRARIFEPFFTTKQPGEGTGMGLATVYGIVRQSGGSINVYSEPGHGTSFRIYLPRVDEPATAPAEARPAAEASTGSEAILLVEDEGAVRTYASRVLEDRGYRVLAAAGGGEALALAAAHEGRIDLLVTDVIMPGMQGHQLATQLAATRPGMRVLYVSGFTENSVIRQGVASEGVMFLPKPFTAEGLARAVRRALDAAS